MHRSAYIVPECVDPFAHGLPWSARPSEEIARAVQRRAVRKTISYQPNVNRKSRDSSNLLYSLFVYKNGWQTWPLQPAMNLLTSMSSAGLNALVTQRHQHRGSHCLVETDSCRRSALSRSQKGGNVRVMSDWLARDDKFAVDPTGTRLVRLKGHVSTLDRLHSQRAGPPPFSGIAINPVSTKPKVDRSRSLYSHGGIIACS